MKTKFDWQSYYSGFNQENTDKSIRDQLSNKLRITINTSIC